LAWRLHQGEDSIPIAGTRSRERLTENVKAADIALDAGTLEKISELAAPGMGQGQTLLP
jgi:aryl-alcohol dehydrogenase-like predicted oxidoreductase